MMARINRFGVIFIGLLILFLTATSARADAFKEVWVNSFCKSGKVFKEMHHLFEQGDVASAEMHYRLQVQSGECTDLSRYGWFVSFIGERISARYKNDHQGETAVVEGYVVNADESRGQKAFVWVRKKHLKNFVKGQAV